VLVADAPQFLHENGRSDDVSAFALNRLDKNGGDFFRRENSLKQFVFDVARATEREFVGILRTTRAAAIHIGIADVVTPARAARSAASAAASTPSTRALPWCAHGKRRRRRSCAAACCDSAPASERTRRLPRRSFRNDLVRSRHGHNLREALGQRHHALVVEVGARHVNQFARLLLNGGDHFG